MATTKDLTVELDTELITRLKVYSAATGKTIKSLVGKWISEKVPPMPAMAGKRLTESEATA